MKKSKEESPLKVARKKTRETIETRLNKLLKTITTELGQEAFDIEKEAKKLAKKITKGLKANKKTDEVKSTVNGIEKAVKAGNGVKPVGKSPVSNAKKPTVKAAVPSKTVIAPKVKVEAGKTTDQKKVKK